MKDIIMQCPKCEEYIKFKKKKLIDCKCGTRVLLYRMNNNLLVEDVTPNEKQVNYCEVN